MTLPVLTIKMNKWIGNNNVMWDVYYMKNYFIL